MAPFLVLIEHGSDYVKGVPYWVYRQNPECGETREKFAKGNIRCTDYAFDYNVRRRSFYFNLAFGSAAAPWYLVRSLRTLVQPH